MRRKNFFSKVRKNRITKQKTLVPLIMAVICCFTMVMSKSTVYALSPGDFIGIPEYEDKGPYSYEISDYTDLEAVSTCIENLARENWDVTGEKIIWAICSLNNHKDLQFYIFYEENEKKYEELLKRTDCDFIQIGWLLTDISDISGISFVQSIREAFEEDALATTLSGISSTNISYDDEIYEQLKNLPVYWEITENDSDVLALEVAIGKYVIQRGDTLSEIAVSYQTTVDKLLEWNSNISNPDMIYEGDYLVIKK